MLNKKKKCESSTIKPSIDSAIPHVPGVARALYFVSRIIHPLSLSLPLSPPSFPLLSSTIDNSDTMSWLLSFLNV